MKIRNSVNAFINYFENKIDMVFKIENLSGSEREFWNGFEIIQERQNEFNVSFEQECYISLALNEKNIFDIIAILTKCNEVYYIFPEIKFIKEVFEQKQITLLYTESSILSEKDLYNLKEIERKRYEMNEVMPPNIMENLNEYQIIDRSIIDYENYMSHIGQTMVKNCLSLQFSRGCTFNCAYCQKVYLSSYRNRSVENIFEEIEMYYKIGIKRFSFVDDLPNFNRDESIKLFKRIYNSGMKVQLFFPNGLRGDLLDFEYIDYMVQAGTVNIDLALETASPRLQKLINKNLNLAKLNENIEYILQNHKDVILELQMMIGLPTETGEEAMKSLNFIKNLRWIDFPYMHVLKIYPNTPMARLALENGVLQEQIEQSNDLGYHELPNTLPFSKVFVKKCQSDLLKNYFLNKDRLKLVLAKQSKIMTEEELVLKYDSYLPIKIESIGDILDLADIKELNCIKEEKYSVENLNEKIRNISPQKKVGKNKFIILLLDLTLDFDEYSDKIYHVVEPPLGQMYILSYLNKMIGEEVEGKILKSGIDFKDYFELKKVIDAFHPHFIGIRSMNYYKNFSTCAVAQGLS